MLWKRKEKNVKKYYDEKLEEYLSQLEHAMWDLQKVVKEVLTKKLAVEVYPEGADKEQAKQDLAKAQRSLICHVGAVDARRQEAIDYYNTHLDSLKDFNYKHPSLYSTGHQVIENTIKSYYDKK